MSYLDYLIEDKSTQKGQSIQRILTTEFPKSEIIFNIDEKLDKIYLNVVLVPFKKRKQGKANKFMKRLKELAKEYKKDIYLNVSDAYAEENDPKRGELFNWYTRLGFQKTKNFKLNQEMVYKV